MRNGDKICQVGNNKYKQLAILGRRRHAWLEHGKRQTPAPAGARWSPRWSARDGEREGEIEREDNNKTMRFGRKVMDSALRVISAWPINLAGMSREEGGGGEGRRTE